MRFEDLVTAQFPRGGRKLLETPGVVEFDIRHDPAAVAAVGRLQAGTRQPVPILQKCSRPQKIANEITAILLPRNRIAGQHRNGCLQCFKRLAGPMLVLQNDWTRLAGHLALQTQRGLDRRMQHALSVPHPQARIVGINANSAKSGDPGQPRHEQLELGFKVVRAHHR